MSLIYPRLDRIVARELIGEHRYRPLSEIGELLPLRPEALTYPPIGGERVDEARLVELRAAMLRLASEHGMPGEPSRELKRFEGRAARLIHSNLPMTAHEAADHDVWTYLTVCWLFDVAVWRFGADTAEYRFLGHLNRNTFRRMWWRAEILGPDIDLEELGEDELTAIMERPTLFSDRRLARAIVGEFLERVKEGEDSRRQDLMRQATKRLLRLTPFVAFPALSVEELRHVVRETFDAAHAGIHGLPAPQGHGPAPVRTLPSPEVTVLPRTLIPPLDEGGERVASSFADLDDVRRAALDIAARTGRVTNMALRELSSIPADEARGVLASLVEAGALERRGAKRGTHYVLAPTRGRTVAEAPSSRPAPPSPQEAARNGTERSVDEKMPASRTDALRRLLRRRG